MTEPETRRTAASDLANEAPDWETCGFSPRARQDAPEAIPRVGNSTAISIRIPSQMLTLLKEFARRQGIGYQVLMKRWLDDRIRSERDKLADHEADDRARGDAARGSQTDA